MALVAAVSFFFVVASLLVVGVVSWRRTRALRRGVMSQAPDPPAALSFSSSGTTFLAFLAGVAAMAWGAATAAEAVTAAEASIEAVCLATAGLFIAVAGWVGRVAQLQAGRDGLLIVFARRRPFSAAWPDIRAMEPPGTPIGGWRLTTATGIRSTLMPSDLFRHEEVLHLIALRADLWFDGRMWRHRGGEHDSPRIVRSGKAGPRISPARR